ncbi:MAG: BREX system ATP-binding domain-containing protein [Thermodesulfobacteriota bacterium]|nr:BREX system ATP-binding domain-containing protein [Thermodesulfobacteriota bacterium]
MDMEDFSSLLENSDNFLLRRAVERLRDGLFDPFAVQLLTARETQLNTAFDKGVHALTRNESPHLCVCGSYGQGKSHSLTYIRERALDQGFVTSLINLDPREIPFHDFQQVYRALVSGIRFPGSDDTLVQYWKKWTSKQKQNQKISRDNRKGLPACIPDAMPHFFKSVLTALARKNIPLSTKQKRLKKNITFRPREFPWILANALKGESLPVFRLRHALKYRQVPFYKDASLVCKGWNPFFQAVCSLAQMFQNMGFKGWVLLFDEGESIGQRPINIRRKSYTILDHFFSPASPVPGLYPIFAFTDDFFRQVQDEDYERVYTRQEQELPYFEKNYGKAWHQLNYHHLHDLGAKDWQNLVAKLIRLHAGAYDWKPSAKEISDNMAAVLKTTGEQEARLKIKAFVEHLDLAQQKLVLTQQ